MFLAELPEIAPSLMSSSKKSKTRSRSARTNSNPVGSPWNVAIGVVWFLRFCAFVFVFASPWYFGSVLWRSQSYLIWGGMGLSILLCIYSLYAWMTRQRDGGAPWLSWWMVGLAAFAWLQSVPMFGWDGSTMAPPSVVLQRWALGISPPPSAITRDLIQIDASANSSAVPSDLLHIPESERFLSISVEPLHTRGAVGSLLLCALMVWLGRCAFATPQSHLYLFGILTGIGLLISAFGIHGAISYQATNFLGLKSGGSFASFVSKNSAGAFLNVCMAGGIGLVAWTFIHLARKSADTRYRFPDTSLLAKIRGTFEDVLADLTTLQIGALLCLVAILCALLISMCRGAIVSAAGGVVCSVLMLSAFNKSSRGLVFLGGIVLASILFLGFFRLDDQIFSRLESLGDLDFVQESSTGRTYIWWVALKATEYFGWLGSGLGTFHFAALPFQDATTEGWYYHAESLFAECAVELGFIGLGAALIGLLVLFYQMRSIAESESFRAYAPIKLAGSFLFFSQSFHALVDFGQILPAVYLPTSLLLGAAIGASYASRDESRRIRSRRKRTDAIAESKGNKAHDDAIGFPIRLAGASSLAIGILIIMGLRSVEPAIRSLAQTESIVKQVNDPERKKSMERNGESVAQLASLWKTDVSAIQSNPEACLQFGNAFLNDFRTFQYREFPKTMDRDRAWNETSPLIYRLALINATTDSERQAIDKAIGGPVAREKFLRASRLFALGHVKCPLDWKLVWSRALTAVDSSMGEQSRLIAPIQRVSQHNAAYLLSASMLFRTSLESEQRKQLWQQAMRCDPSSSINVARLIAQSPDGDSVGDYLDILPQTPQLIRHLAEQIFPKGSFPKSNRDLWELYRSLILKSEISNAKKALWLADAAKELGDTSEEIKQLRDAARFMPSDIPLSCRLAERLRESGDVEAARSILFQLRLKDPNHNDVKNLSAKLDLR